MAPAVLNRVLSSSSSTATPPPSTRLAAPRPALLSHYRRHRVKGADYPAIVPASAKASSGKPSDDTEASVRGVLVSGLTDADMWRLDVFEGPEYARVPVTVRMARGPLGQAAKTANGGGSEDEDDVGANADSELEHAVETYVWTGDVAHLEEREWDFAEFVREKMWRWAPSMEGEREGEYAELDAAVAAQRGDSEEDDAERVDALERDPTGGRGVNGWIGKALEGK